MPATRKLTDTSVPRLPRPGPGEAPVYYYDTAIAGLAVRVWSSGARAWVLRSGGRGQQRRVTLGRWPDMREAEARAEAHARLGTPANEHPRPARGTLADVIDHFQRHHITRIKGRPITDDPDVVRRLKWLRDTWGHRKPASITTRDVLELLEPFRDRRFEYNNRRMIVRQILGKAHVSPNPVADVPMLRNPGRHASLTAAERVRLLKAIVGHKDPIARGYFLALVYTGCRPGELRRLRWADLDLERRAIVLPSTKSGRDRVLPITSGVATALASIPARPGNPYVFHGRRPGAPLTQPKKAWEAVRTSAGLPKLRMHDLRHAAAALLRSRGVHMSVIQQVLGHSSPTVTARYLDENPDDIRAALEQLSK